MKEVQEDNFPSHKLTKHNNDPESKTIINSLAAVCFDEDVEKEVFEKVGDYYSLETDQLIMDHKMFQVFKVND